MQARRHHGAQGHARDRPRVDAVLAQHGEEECPQLVRGIEGLGGLAELAAQAVAFIDAAVDLGVADIKTEEHGRIRVEG